MIQPEGQFKRFSESRGWGGSGRGGPGQEVFEIARVGSGRPMKVSNLMGRVRLPGPDPIRKN